MIFLVVGYRGNWRFRWLGPLSQPSSPYLDWFLGEFYEHGRAWRQ